MRNREVGVNENFSKKTRRRRRAVAANLQGFFGLAEEAAPRGQRRVPAEVGGGRPQRQVQPVGVAPRQRLQFRRHRFQQRLVLLRQVLKRKETTASQI